jgi:hypothetical protein
VDSSSTSPCYAMHRSFPARKAPSVSAPSYMLPCIDTCFGAFVEEVSGHHSATLGL